MEGRSVSPLVLRDYFKRLNAMHSWAVIALAVILPISPSLVLTGQDQSLPHPDLEILVSSWGAVKLLLSDEMFDIVLNAYMDCLFFKGRPAADGEKLVAAVAFFLPRFSKHGVSGLPRAGRALRG